MKQVFLTCLFLGGVSLGCGAQGLAGKLTLSGQVIAVTGHCVNLTWNASPNAASYNIYRGTTHGGPYLRVASGVTTSTYTDDEITHDQTLYYVTTSVSGAAESRYSNETVAAIP